MMLSTLFRSRPFLFAALLAGATACSESAATSRTAAGGDLARGKYLVEHVGLCTDCHNPRDEQGEFVRERWLMGAMIPMTPTVPMPWAPVSPQIAGLPTLTEEQAVHFLQTGELPNGRRPRAPMPPYRMDEGDAKAVVAYLKSMAPKQAQ